jgi:hypothetical protein
MNRLILITGLVLGMLTFTFGCSQSGPIAPDNSLSQTPKAVSGAIENSQTNLWGYYDVYIDLATREVTSTLNRQAMFTANVVNFLNSKPTNLGFHINDTPVGAGYVDVDIDVAITHPFPGLHQYDGYDVRGVFMGNGSNHLAYNPDLSYAMLGTDQFMLADPDDGIGSPDGYTRWFNKPEFSGSGMPLFQYTQGKVATPNFAGTAILNPYKYFADNLGKNDNLWTWLADNASAHGIFTSGSTNTRNYYLRFPTSPGVKYGYAVIANWAGTAPEFHPSNAPEAVAVLVSDNSNVFYVDSSTKGGSLNFDISVWDWDSQISAGMMEDYKLFIESTVLLNPYELSTSEMTPTGGNENYSTYHVEIPADNINSVDGNEYWVIAEDQSHNYQNSFNVINLADTDPLTAFFRFNLDVSPIASNSDPVCDLIIDPSTPVPMTDLSPVAIKFDASASSDPDGDILTFSWDFNGDGTFGGPEDSYKGTPDKPTHGYLTDYNGKAYVKVTDGVGGEAICSVDVSVVAKPSKNLPLRPGVDAFDLAVNGSDGNLTILYSDDYIYKYLTSEYYQIGNVFYQKLFNNWHAPQFHEVNNDGFTINGGYVTVASPPWDAPQAWFYKPGAVGPMDFVSIWSMQYVEPMPVNIYFDVVSFGNQTDYPTDMGGVYGYDESGAHWVRMFRHHYSSNYFNFAGWYTTSFTGSVFTGQNKLYWQYIKAVETDQTGKNVWFVENTDCYASRWSANNSILTYDNAAFGTGSPGDADDTWSNAQDITRDNQNRYFVLDKLTNGSARIKMWTVSGNTTTSEGGFGDTTTISGTPLRIEGGDFNGRIYVLHGNATNGYFLSIFSPIEMPD